MRNISIQCVFLNNLIFQLFNHFILPSSMLVRLVNISMFRCNNEILFVTSSFVGWSIGHILFITSVISRCFWIITLQVYALTKERDTLRREQNKKSDAASLLKEKDEIINQVMAEGEELLSLVLCVSNGILFL